MEIRATRSVLSGNAIRAILNHNNVWMAVSENDLPDENSDFNIEGTGNMEEEDLYARLPYLKGKLNIENGTLIYVDEKTGQININKAHRFFGISTAEQARATNQAAVKISILKYLYTRSQYTGLLIFIISFLIFLGHAVLWVFYFYAFRIFYTHLLTLFRDRNLFMTGDLNPGIVIHTYPTRIAVLSNLSRGRGNYPVIKIKKVELPLKYRKPGTRIPVACGFNNLNDQPYWDYLDPLPIPSSVTNSKIVEEKIKHISSYDWIKLQKELKNLPAAKIPGYYPIEKDTSSWKKVENPKFN